MQWTNTTAWITGAGKRLGRAIALELARRGCNLALHYGHSAADAHEVARAAEDMGRRTRVIRADLAQVEDIRSMGRQIESKFGGVDILINCAANFERVPLEQIEESHWDRALDVNLKGSAFCALEAARLMRLKRKNADAHLHPSPTLGASFEAECAVINLDDPAAPVPAQADPLPPNTAPPLYGKIINFADWSALRPYRNFLPYMISKGGIVTLTQTLAQELAPEITVNAVAPGTVLPPQNTGAAELEKICANVPLGRIGAPEDIVRTIVFLLESDYITGQIICVDGGRYVAQPVRS